jgi:hypothetical protein
MTQKSTKAAITLRRILPRQSSMREGIPPVESRISAAVSLRHPWKSPIMQSSIQHRARHQQPVVSPLGRIELVLNFSI